MRVYIAVHRQSSSECVPIASHQIVFPDTSAQKNCDDPEWSISNAKRRGRVAIDNLWLVRVSYAHSNIWVADLEIL